MTVRLRTHLPSITRLLCAFVFLLCCAVPGWAQIFNLTGGTSTLYDAQGGSINIYNRNFESSFGIGNAGSHIRFGGRLARKAGNITYIVGDERIPLRFSTDLFDSSHYFLARGAGVSTTKGKTDIFLFAGKTAVNYGNAFFQGGVGDSQAAFFRLTRELAGHLRIQSHNIVGRRFSSIQSLEWTPEPGISGATSFGLGAGKPYVSTSVDVSRSWMDLRAAITGTDQRFQRVLVQSPDQSETNRENVLLAIRPSTFFSFSLGRQNFLMPSSESSALQTSVNQVSANLSVAGAGLSASLYRSSLAGRQGTATSFSVGRNITSRLHVSGTLLESRQQEIPAIRTVVAHFTEKISPRLSLIQAANFSNGRANVSFGGQLLGNFLTVGVDYQTFYTPANMAAFQQAVIVNLRMRLFRGVTFQGATFVSPDGRMRYTAGANGVVARGEAASAYTPAFSSLGKAVISGKVVDDGGTPIAGAAITLDSRVIYTDSNGRFFFRERKSKTHRVQVLMEQFLNPGDYEVVSLPDMVQSSSDEYAKQVTIILKKVNGTKVAEAGLQTSSYVEPTPPPGTE